MRPCANKKQKGITMFKTTIKLALLTIFASVLFISKAFALDYETAYMVRDNNSRILSTDASNQYSYFAGETPWVYVKFKLEDLNTNSPLHLHWVWSSLSDPNNTETQNQKITIAGLGADKEIWSSAPQPWWTTDGGPGTWHVDVNWFNVDGTNGISSANFTSCDSGGILGRQSATCGPVVTPEPLSSTLFLLGGAPLIAAIRKRQKSVSLQK